MASRSPDTSATGVVPSLVERANAEALARLCDAEPVLLDVRPAGEIVPRMTPNTILASGAPLAWDDYHGGQRNGIIGGALFEGLARDAEEADAKIRAGEIRLRTCQELGCIGSLAGIYTASMPVFVVEERRTKQRAFCNLFEGPSPKRLNYGLYNEEVKGNLLILQELVGPMLSEAVRAAGGVELRPIIRRALHMGDELHSRNTAATLLFTRELFPALLDVGERRPNEVRELLDYLGSSDYFFLRLSMAAGKATGDAAHGVEGSSVVTSMTLSCRDFAIRVSGLGEGWFRSDIPHGEVKLFEGYSESDVEYMGGESLINETVGLGGFAQAAALALQAYQGGSPDVMIERNLEMYEITVGEHSEFKIPYFGFRGVPVGIDVLRVVATGIRPVIDMGVAGKMGGQIGAGILRAPLTSFQAAAEAYAARYEDA
jgi:hypothetical protein